MVPSDPRNNSFSSRHTRPELGIQRGCTVRLSASRLRLSAAALQRFETRKLASLVGAGLSKRPFAPPQRAYPLRHSHGGFVVPGLFLRCRAFRLPRPLTLSSAPRRPTAFGGEVRCSAPVSRPATGTSDCLPISRSPSGFFFPSGSQRSNRLASGKAHPPARPISLRSPTALGFVSSRCRITVPGSLRPVRLAVP